MAEDFTIAGYRALIEAFRDNGYTARSYTDATPDRRHLIVRHDLDISLQAAIPIAEIEHELGVAATYFALLRTEMYNAWSAAGRETLGRIAGLGHEVGLHLDATLYDEEPEAIEAGAAVECRVLEELTGRPVTTISFHRPVPALQGLEGTIAGRRHAYEPAFIQDMGYCSDSRGAWHHGPPLKHAAVSAGRALQLLTHPIWWNGKGGRPEARLRRWLRNRNRELDLALAAQSGVHIPANVDTKPK